MSTNSTASNREDSQKKRKNKKALRNEEKKRSLASIEAESKLAKMRYYWIFNIVWTLLGCFLLAIGQLTQDAQIKAAPTFPIGVFIILLSAGMGIYGARMQFKLKKKAGKE